MTTTPNLALPYLQPQQAQKHVTMNDALQTLDALTQISVLSRSITTPPSTPSEGDRYLPAGTLSGDWAGLESHLLIYVDAAWRAFTPLSGWLVWIQDEDRLVVYDGAAWTQAITGIDRLGINADADPLNRFVLKSEASLLDHDGDDHRLKLNKAGEADIGSLAFQTDYATYAEIGLIGTDDLTISVSPDGVAFQPALSFNRDTGYMGAGTADPVSRLHLKQIADARLTIETESVGSGGGFDITNSGTGQSWRVTGQTELFKFRDHTAGLNKLLIYAGSSGNIIMKDCGNVGIGTDSPTAALHVGGAVRVGSYTVASLPSASAQGAGAIVFVTDASGGATLAYSDGTNWRRAKDGATL